MPAAQRFLESNKFTVNEAFNRARSLYQAQEYSATYASKTDLVSATIETGNDAPDLTPKSSTKVLAATAPSGGKKCYFCGSSYHKRAECPAKEMACFSCEKVGHFSHVYRAKHAKATTKSSTSQANALNSPSPSPSFSMHAAACPGSLIKAALEVRVNGTKLTTLIDSGSSESYINSETHKKLELGTIPSSHNVQMASAAIKMKSSGFCVADITINDTIYEATRLNVLDNLCSDIILGLDFQSQHQRLVFFI